MKKIMVVFEHLGYSFFTKLLVDNINQILESKSEEVDIGVVVLDHVKSRLPVHTSIFTPSALNGIVGHSTFKPIIFYTSMQSYVGHVGNAEEVLLLYDLDWMYRPMSYDLAYSIIGKGKRPLLAARKSVSRLLHAIWPHIETDYYLDNDAVDILDIAHNLCWRAENEVCRSK